MFLKNHTICTVEMHRKTRFPAQKKSPANAARDFFCGPSQLKQFRLPPADGLIDRENLINQCVVVRALNIEIKGLNLATLGDDLHQFLGVVIGLRTIDIQEFHRNTPCCLLGQ